MSAESDSSKRGLQKAISSIASTLIADSNTMSMGKFSTEDRDEVEVEIYTDLKSIRLAYDGENHGGSMHLTPDEAERLANMLKYAAKVFR